MPDVVRVAGTPQNNLVSRFSSRFFGFGGFEAGTSRLWAFHPTLTGVMV
jgi:hypothetical protein